MNAIILWRGRFFSKHNPIPPPANVRLILIPQNDCRLQIGDCRFDDNRARVNTAGFSIYTPRGEFCNIPLVTHASGSAQKAPATISFHSIPRSHPPMERKGGCGGAIFLNPLLHKELVKSQSPCHFSNHGMKPGKKAWPQCNPPFNNDL